MAASISAPNVVRVTPWARIRAHLELIRPGNTVTAIADVLAGYAVAGLPDPSHLPLLIPAGAALYGGGVTFNDYFDRRVDAHERPERPLPSARVRPGVAAAIGAALLGGAIVAAVAASPASGMIAMLIAACAVFYDAVAKNSVVLGPVFMGLCRALNLLLGLSSDPRMLVERWPVALLSLCYVAAITIIARGEVNGGSRRERRVAVAMFSAVLLAIPAGVAVIGLPALWVAPFWAFLVWRLGGPLVRVCRAPEPQTVRGAVKAAVLSLVVLDAAIAAGFAGPWFGFRMSLVMVTAWRLGRLFPVA